MHECVPGFDPQVILDWFDEGEIRMVCSVILKPLQFGFPNNGARRWSIFCRASVQLDCDITEELNSLMRRTVMDAGVYFVASDEEALL